MSGRPLGLFEATGIELEYMIVDRGSLAVRPVADELLKLAAGAVATEVEIGPVAWSNELALHVIEMKTNGPAVTLDGVAEQFHDSVKRINAILEPLGAQLLPTAMHPWMDPDRDLVLWPHEASPIYDAFHRVFDCRGHGWANLQSMHINLPFADDDEFGRLHAAIRLLLPILPALAASSPLADGALSGRLDTRLEYYRYNAAKIPSVAGVVIPERVFSPRAYRDTLLQRMYDDLAPYDPAGVLRHEWTNSRGCIARFERHALEIRVLDVQEAPHADLAVCAAVVAVLRALVGERWSSYGQQRTWAEARLAAILVATIGAADQAVITDRPYLDALGYGHSGPVLASELWAYLIDATFSPSEAVRWREPLDLILEQGCLARRIRDALPARPARGDIDAVYRRLAECLAHGRLFRADA